MLLVDGEECDAVLSSGREKFPPEVDFLISALEAGPRPLHDRHQMRRSRYRVKAVLRLFSDVPDAAPWVLYTRNVSPQALGFVSQQHLPLSHGGIVHLPAPDGRLVQFSCTVLRCREAAPGWYEGAIYFNRQQSCFRADEMARVA